MSAIVQRYIDADRPWPASSRDIAAWAIRAGQWIPEPSALITKCADELSRAMREEHIRDPQGRSIRAKHAARIMEEGTQSVLWADIRRASPEHMKIAFQQRRQQIVGDCRQLKSDVDSFNDNRSEVAPIQMIFDFTLDLDELGSDNAAA